MHHFKIGVAALAACALLAGTAAAQDPATPASSAVAAPADDPYLWLESVDSPEAMKWVRAENAKTLDVLEKDPRFAANHEQALAVAQSRDRIPSPRQLGGAIYNFWQDAEHVRGLWRTTTRPDYDAGGTPAWQAVLDLDKVAADEKANWVWDGATCEPRREQRCVLSLSDGGEDAITAREFDLKSRAFVAGGFVLPKGKQTFAWADPDTLLVAREWSKGELTTSGYPYVVKRLKRGQALDKAVEVYRGQAGDAGGVSLTTFVDDKGHQALLIDRELSTFESETFLVTPAGAKRLALPSRHTVQDLFDGQLLVQVREDWEAGGTKVAAGALVSVDLARATAHPDALVPVVVYAPSPRQTLESVTATRDGLLLTTLDEVRGRIARVTRTKEGRWTSTPLPVPDFATVRVVDADPHSSAAYFSVQGFLDPSALWRADTASGKAARIRALPPQFDAARDEVEQFQATSSDGTKVPYFIVHPKGMKADGANPTIINAYGGFNVSLSPNYSGITGKLWLEHGGVWVVANIRGGAEFGPAWHDAGLKTRRQVIYDDFAAVARDLVERKITSARRLGIMGGSNGGLLMGVEMTQHPELWNAVDIQVPLLDMLRYEQIAAGTSWVGEYGSVSVPEERAFLAKISPYHQLRRGVQYPRALIWTTTKDDRVGPQHARKFAARLSEFGVPYYYYEVIEGGHGAGANLKERAHTSAIEFTYFSRQLMD